MSAADYNLPDELEALLQLICLEQNIPARQHDELRSLITSPPSTWPACCGGSCTPCVEDPKAVAREILARWSPMIPR
jgi:hypothetical protein